MVSHHERRESDAGGRYQKPEVSARCSAQAVRHQKGIRKNTGAGGCSGIFCGTSFFCGIGQIQHRAKGVKDEVLDAGCDQQALLLGKQRDRHGIAEQLALTIAQQAAAGASGGLGAGLQLGGIQGICIAGQAAAAAVNWFSMLYTLPPSALMGAKAMV